MSLGQERNPATKESLDWLEATYLQFREKVEPIADEISHSAPNYTEHGISHSDQLWTTASIILGDKISVNPAEAFVLGGAFLIHDLGMGLSAYEEGIQSIIEDPTFMDLLAKNHPHDYAEILKTLKQDIAENPTWDGLRSQEAKHVIIQYMRKNHAQQAEVLMQRTWESPNGPTHLISDEKARHWYADAIGRVAKSHWTHVSELQQLFSNLPLGSAPDLPDEWTIDELKIACLLRLADAINIDGSRADIMLKQHRKPQGESKTHWTFQERLMKPQINGQRVVFSSSAPFSIDEIDAWWMAFDVMKEIDAELRRVDNLNVDLGRPRFAASGVLGVDSSVRFAERVRTQGWLPIDAKPHIADSMLVIERLGGKALYGISFYQWTPIRELLANALDATRAMRLAYPADSPRPISVKFDKRADNDVITIRDYGIGMTEDDIINRLCNFGSSGWMDEDTHHDAPGVVAAGYKPTGQFGIGFFSAFMISRGVKVISRHRTAGMPDTLVLEFVDGLSSRPIMRRANKSEQFMYSGTQVELTLSVRFHEKEGLFEYQPPSWTNDENFLKRWLGGKALMSDENIDVLLPGGETAIRAISRNEWETMSPRKLLEYLNSGVNFSRPEYLGMIERFTAGITPIYDDNGNMLGRIGVDLVEHSSDSGKGLYATTSNGYIGGLESCGLHGLIGVLAGLPVGAARDAARFPISFERLRTWYRSQVEELLVSRINTDESQLCRIQEYGIRLGIATDSLPIGFGATGYLTPVQLAEALEKMESITIIESSGSYLNTQLGRVLGYRIGREEFATAMDGQIVVPLGYGVSDSNEQLPFRSDELKETFAEYVPTTDYFDPVSWWKRDYTSPAAEVLRICAKVWKKPLENVVLSLEGAFNERDVDRRLVVTTISGNIAREGGIRVSK